MWFSFPLSDPLSLWTLFQYGMEEALSHGSVIESITLSMDTSHVALKADIPKFLASVAVYSPDAYESVMSAMETFKQKKRERKRFYKLVKSLKTGPVEEKMKRE